MRNYTPWLRHWYEQIISIGLYIFFPEFGMVKFRFSDTHDTLWLLAGPNFWTKERKNKKQQNKNQKKQTNKQNKYKKEKKMLIK